MSFVNCCPDVFYFGQLCFILLCLLALSVFEHRVRGRSSHVKNDPNHPLKKVWGMQPQQQVTLEVTGSFSTTKLTISRMAFLKVPEMRWVRGVVVLINMKVANDKTNPAAIQKDIVTTPKIKQNNQKEQQKWSHQSHWESMRTKLGHCPPRSTQAHHRVLLRYFMVPATWTWWEWLPDMATTGSNRTDAMMLLKAIRRLIHRNFSWSNKYSERSRELNGKTVQLATCKKSKHQITKRCHPRPAKLILSWLRKMTQTTMTRVPTPSPPLIN